jgi:hypothetical protein
MTMKAQSFKILKNKLVKDFRKKGDNACLTVMGKDGVKQYTGNEVANEIQNETEFGINCINTLIGLTIDLLSRNKMTWEDRNTNCRTWVKKRIETTQKEKKALGTDTPDKLKRTAGKGGKVRAFKEVLSYLETH